MSLKNSYYKEKCEMIQVKKRYQQIHFVQNI